MSGEEMKSDLPRGVGRSARRALAEAGYTRLEQLTEVREAEILKLHGVGPKAVGEIRRDVNPQTVTRQGSNLSALEGTQQLLERRLQ